MRKIIVNCLILFVVVCCERSFGQSLLAEVTGMETDWSFSGSFSTKLSKTSKLSFSNTSRISSDYQRNEKMYMLMITNLSYTLTKKLKSTIGGMYINGVGVKPSIGLQYLVASRHVQWMLFPNLNIGKQTDLMNISMIQYMGNISEKMELVLRMQSLSILNANSHLFSTMRLRNGFIRGKFQFGVASDFDFYGSDFAIAKSFGLFLQYQLL